MNAAELRFSLSLLRQARRLISRKGGWMQNALTNGAGSYCALGALNKVSGRPLISDLIAIDALEASLPRRYYDVAEYNDAPRRTQAQIISLYDRAIARVTKDLAKKSKKS